MLPFASMGRVSMPNDEEYALLVARVEELERQVGELIAKTEPHDVAHERRVEERFHLPPDSTTI